ncbi:MAG: ABC transporter substrate-binding protein [Dehalococcoidia bacterium]
MSRLTVAGALLIALVLASISTFAASAERTVSVAAREPAPAAASIRPQPEPPAVSAAVAGGGAAIEGDRMSRITAAGELVVAVVNLDRYPFFYTNAKGELVGSDIDLARDIAHELGVEAKFNRTSATFDGVVDLVAKGQADIAISKLSVTLPRARQVRFTRPYVELAQGLMLNRVRLTALSGNEKDIVTQLDHPDHHLGAVKGTSYVGFGHTLFPEAQFTEFPDKNAMFAAVLGGDVIGVLYDENEIKQYIFEKPDRLINLKVHMLPGHTDPIGIAVSDAQLQYWLDTYLELKRVKLSVNDLLQKYPRPEAR